MNLCFSTFRRRPAIAVDFALIPCETPWQESGALKYVMSRHSCHFRPRPRAFEQPRFLVDTGKLEAGL